MTDTIIVLRQMRSMLRLPPAMYADLNAALVAHDSASEPKKAIVTWLHHYECSTLAF
jgi:hypothetical protein